MRYRPLLRLGIGPCAKQTVRAFVVSPNGDTFEGTNHCEAPQKECPRQGMPTGQGYELCKAVCHQPAHAELNALELAGERARGATLVIEGHTYACESCRAAARAAGIVRLVVAGQERSLDTGLEASRPGHPMHTNTPHTAWIGGEYPRPLQDCSGCQGTGSAGYHGCTDCLGTGKEQA
jgi:hypothetical protein